MKILLPLAAICCILAPAASYAEDATQGVPASCASGQAKLAMTTGKALISRGGSFSEIKSGAGLSVGDRLLVREGSASVVVGSKSFILIEVVVTGRMQRKFLS